MRKGLRRAEPRIKGPVILSSSPRTALGTTAPVHWKGAVN